jgi:hypothetical protein
MVAYESRLELARIMLADFSLAVTGLVAQPFQLTGPDGGRDRCHVPDLLLVSSDGLVTVVDVKVAHRLQDPGVRAQFSWTREVARCRGWEFEAWSGSDRVLLDNVRFLAGYRRSLVATKAFYRSATPPAPLPHLPLPATIRPGPANIAICAI